MDDQTNQAQDKTPATTKDTENQNTLVDNTEETAAENQPSASNVPTDEKPVEDSDQNVVASPSPAILSEAKESNQVGVNTASPLSANSAKQSENDEIASLSAPRNNTESKEDHSVKSPETSELSEPSDLSDSSDLSEKSESSESAEPVESSDSSEEPLSPSPKLKNDVPGAHWYVVHTYSGHEAKVAATLKQRVESQQLQDKVLDILVPTQEKIEIKEGKKNKIKEKIFPGYLLIRMVLDDNTWLVVRTTPGITSFVGMGNKPTPLPDAEVASIQRFMSMEAPKFKASFSVSEAVKIVDGPFSEFLGTISEIDNERGKIKVLVSIFGRETPVELDFLQVAKL